MSSFQIPFDSPRLTPLKENNFQYKPTSQQILSYAEEVLELNLSQDEEFLFLAEQALKAPLPQNWQACEYFEAQHDSQAELDKISQEECIIVYRNSKTKEVIFDHPLDSLYRQRARQLKLMKNTAKYSENVTPINEQLIQSSLVMVNKNNSSKKQNENSINNNSSVGLEESKSRVFNGSNFRASQIVRNITEQSMAYEEELQGEEEFQNLSMITDHQQEPPKDIFQSIPDLQAKLNQKVLKTKFPIKKSSFPSDMLLKIDKKLNNIQKLKQKQKTIRPIIIPTEEQVIKNKQKKKQRAYLLQSEIKKEVTRMVISKLLEVNQTQMYNLSQKLKTTLTIKQMQEKMIILRQFKDTTNFKWAKNKQVQNEINRIRTKQQSLRNLQRQNKVMDEKIKQITKLIELQKKS